MIVLFVIGFSLAFKLSSIPPSGTGPNSLQRSSACYDPYRNRILIFGGQDDHETIYSSSLYTLDLATLKWNKIIYQSLLIPEGLIYPHIDVTTNNTLNLYFGHNHEGISGEVFIFNMRTNIWKVQPQSGYEIPGLSNSAFATFTYQGIMYSAFYGGITAQGLSDQLYLLNTQTFEGKIMPKNGQAPSKMFAATLTFFKDSLYLLGYSGQESKKISDLYRYNLTTNLWAILNTTGDAPSDRAFHDSFTYNSCMFTFFGVQFDNNQLFDTIYKFNYLTLVWSLVKSAQQDFLIYHSTVQIGSKVYMLLGRNANTTLNSVVYYDLNDANLAKVVVAPNWISPEKRKNHETLVMNDKIYLFGGLSESNRALNDMWAYDITKNIWETVEMNGDIPPARELMGLCRVEGSGFFLFGGRDSTTLYGDLYFFGEESKTWYLYKPINNFNPSGRFGSAICYLSFLTFIIGGQDYTKAYNDIYIYSYLTSTLVIVKQLTPFPLELANLRCWIESKDNQFIIYVISGNTFYFIPNNKIYKIVITPGDSGEYFSNSELLTSINSLAVTEAPLVVSWPYFFLISGSSRDTFVNSSVLSVNMITFEARSQSFEPELSLYGHSAAYYKNSIYVFGGGLGLDTIKDPASVSNQFYKLTRSDNETNFLRCSPGTIDPECITCEKGYLLINNTCVPCPAGRFSTRIASYNAEQCIPCDFGSYSERVGATYCQDCPSNFYCPIGSNSPKPIQPILKNFVTQPSRYSESNPFDNIIYLLYLLIFLALSLIFASFFWKSFRKRLKSLDLFITAHEYPLNTPIRYKKTKIGGIFSICYISAALFTVIVSFLSYTMNNITEIKSLVPVSTLEEIATSDFLSIEVTFYLYGGECIANSTCLPLNTFNDSGFHYSSKSSHCQMIDQNCKFSIIYKDASFYDTSMLNITMQEITAFASYLTINITCSSSIPGENSMVFVSVYPESIGEILRGRGPTIATFEVIPSLFYSDSSKWVAHDSGYHASFIAITKQGSTCTQKTVNISTFLLLSIEIFISQNGFVTRRTINSTFVLFISALLGSAFGLMQTFASFMSVTERIYLSFYRTIKKKTQIKTLAKNRPHINTNFGFIYTPSSSSSAKVYPIEASITRINE